MSGNEEVVEDTPQSGYDIMWFEPSILLKEMKSSVWNFFKFKGTKIKGPNKSTGMESFLDEKIKKKDEEELSDKNVNVKRNI